MFNKIIIIIAAVVVILLGGYFLLRNQPPSKTAPDSSEPAAQTPTAPETPEADQNIVVYTDSGYSPNAFTVKAGTTVIFKNESSKSMWPASAMHPSHRVYSGTPLEEHCPDTALTAFDACTGILPGNSWTFLFDKTGTWKYHDHLSPSYFGSIVVE